MYPAIFYTLFPPNKNKIPINQLINRDFTYPEPVLKRQNRAKTNHSDLMYNILYINKYSLFLIEYI